MMAECQQEYTEAIVRRHAAQALEIAAKFFRLESRRACRGLEQEEIESEAFLSLPGIVEAWPKDQPFDEYLGKVLPDRLRSRAAKLTRSRRRAKETSTDAIPDEPERSQQPDSRAEFWDLIASRLTPGDLEIVRLMHSGTTSQTELAAVTGLDRRTIARRIEAIHEKLKPIQGELEQSSGR